MDYEDEESGDASTFSGPPRWEEHIGVFFYPAAALEHEPREPTHVVDDLVEMRRVPIQVYDSEIFKDRLEESHLLHRFQAICRPGNLLETSHADVERSFRLYNWRTAYGELFVRWTPPVLFSQLEPQPTLPDRPFDPVDFLEFFSGHPRMHPWRSNPIAAYLFISLHSFKANCSLWLIPCLVSCGFGAQNWDVEHVYRLLMQHPIMLEPESESSLLVLEKLDERLRTVVVQTARHRELVKLVNAQMFHPNLTSGSISPKSTSRALITSISSSTTQPARARRATNVLGLTPRPTQKARLTGTQQKNQRNRRKRKLKATAAKDEVLGRSSLGGSSSTPEPPRNTCPGCSHKPVEDWCIRTVYVTETPNASKWRGWALTSAAKHDRLKPKPPKTKSRIYKRTKYISPEQLRLKFFEARPPTTPSGRIVTGISFVSSTGKGLLTIWSGVYASTHFLLKHSGSCSTITVGFGCRRFGGAKRCSSGERMVV
ncbi:hypothetical protein C8R46DRAFT_146331 [Mycena filopes]|nr:hypothetical protein C8R46DRAFT_146331 [Mycena filopes]